MPGSPASARFILSRPRLIQNGTYPRSRSSPRVYQASAAGAFLRAVSIDAAMA